jgi:hypothetical protein
MTSHDPAAVYTQWHARCHASVQASLAQALTLITAAVVDAGPCVTFPVIQANALAFQCPVTAAGQSREIATGTQCSAACEAPGGKALFIGGWTAVCQGGTWAYFGSCTASESLQC